MATMMLVMESTMFNHGDTPAQPINIDKMKVAFELTPLCQHGWMQFDDPSVDTPTRLCAVSALLAHAGVEPALIALMHRTPGSSWVTTLATPVLMAAYHIPPQMVSEIVRVFDNQENEYKGVLAVLAMAECYNRKLAHEQAITEDAGRFPQHMPAPADGQIVVMAEGYPSAWDFTPVDAAPLWNTSGSALPLPKHTTLLGQMKEWTQKQLAGPPA